MYNFKAIDFGLSRQEYIFSLVNMLDKNEFDFVYIPYSQFPAILMLDYILASNPQEFNAELFNYIKEVANSEKFSENNILILSKDFVNRNTFINKFGISVKEANLSKLINENIKGSREYFVFGNIFNLILGENHIRLGNEIDELAGISDIKEFSKIKDIFVSSREEFLADVSFLDEAFKHDEIEAELLNINSSYKENLSDKVDVIIFDSKNLLVNINDGFIAERFNDNLGEILIKDIFAEKLIQHEAVISDINIFTKDYSEIDISSIVNGLREYNYQGIVDSYILSERYSYIQSDILSDIYSTSRSSEVVSKIVDFYGSFKLFFAGFVSDIYDFLRIEYDADVVNLNEALKYDLYPAFVYFDVSGLKANEWYGLLKSLNLYNKEHNAVLSLAFDGTRYSSGEGVLETLFNINKSNEREATVELLITSDFEIERSGELYYLLESTNVIERLVNLIDGSFSGGVFERYSDLTDYINVGGRDREELTNLFFVGNSIRDVERNSILGNYIVSDSEYTSEFLDGYLLDYEYDSDIFTDYLYDYEFDSYIDKDLRFSFKDERMGENIEFYIITTLFNERDTYVFGLTKVRRDDEYLSRLESTQVFDFEKDIFVINKGFAIKDSLSESYLTYLDIGNNGEFRIVDGIVDILFGTKDNVNQVYVVNLNSTELDKSRDTEIEYTIEAKPPRKKLLKSWLGEYERDRRKDLNISLQFEGIKDYIKKLKKYYIDLFEREYVRGLGKESIGNAIRSISKNLNVYDLDFSKIERLRELDKDEIINTVPNIIRIRFLDRDIFERAGKRYEIKPLLKFGNIDFDYEKDGLVHDLIESDYKEEGLLHDLQYFDKYKDVVVSEQKIGQSLMYDYSDILKEGMDVEDWQVGYAIPEDYYPTDPFNPYYPWAEERNSHSLVQAEDWQEELGDWELDKSNVVINAKEGGGILVTKKLYDDFKFKFRVQVGYLPECRTGFVFGYDDINNYYKFTISSGNTPMELIQVINGKTRKIASPMAPFFMDGGSWHEIDVSFVNGNLVIYVDGRQQYNLILER